MFTNRWASGLDQHTGEIFWMIQDSLRLASRFLTEDYFLFWFTRLTFGKRRYDASRNTIFLEPTSYSYSREAIDKVKSNLKELGEVISFMHARRDNPQEAHGITYHCRSLIPNFQQYNDRDWPDTEEKYPDLQFGHDRPCIVLHTMFQVFFRHNYMKNSTDAERFGAKFLFAVTLVREITHAYYFWLGGSIEPLWDITERKGQLGYSWERHILGYVISPVRTRTGVRFDKLYDTQLGTYTNRVDRIALIQKSRGESNAALTFRDTFGRVPTWPLLEPTGNRDSELFMERGCEKFVAVIRAIPMPWIVAWFQEDEWVNRRHMCSGRGYHVPPPLRDAFMIFYENNRVIGRVKRPLNPNLLCDVAIVEAQSGQKLTQGQSLETH
ncbi:hypothetical protein GQ44DRAFT_674191 [Phaeosphaeriaceae sp. PMI808]|nr:hypothetical protein GQ44DRAFT_674191 [Phaeosphaeriaceae sp. PMI808]